MKKLALFTVWLVLALLLTFSPPVSADVIFPNTHPVERSVKIVNLNEFPDIVLIAYVRGPVDSWPTEQYLITNNMYLTKGNYKNNRFDVLWEIQDKSNQINPPIVPKNFAVENIEPYGGYVDDVSPLVKETIEYSIAGFVDGKLVIYKSRQTSGFNNGSPQLVVNFDDPAPTASHQPPEIKAEPVIGPPPSILLTPCGPPLVAPATQVPQEIIVSSTQITVPPPRAPVLPPGLPPRFWQSWAYEQKLLIALLTLVAGILVVWFLYRIRRKGAN